jgi:hypothetical protein
MSGARREMLYLARPSMLASVATGHARDLLDRNADFERSEAPQRLAAL